MVYDKAVNGQKSFVINLIFSLRSGALLALYLIKVCSITRLIS